ncbi:unnamed protein product [Rotaria socialis]|uniref:RING-type domain-containing protein n=1 Tax=Rotaria socialis TaxID=392032 RepID=A0A817XZQ8_9BILA|nr:unnamed protein product [Rotaria socialis]CAF4746281.1 unnamed protein product [Rotaria socialis]
MAITSPSTTTNFEYMDKTSIDKDLNCEFCNNPLVGPVSTPCKHTFCSVCIENKIKKTGGACAKSKCNNKSMVLEDLTPVTERIVLNMLDRLLVKCISCGMTNIQRGLFEKHATKSCLKAAVFCMATDIKCPWTGPSEQLKQHIFTCSYEQLRPVLCEIMQDNRHLKEKIQHMSEQCLKNHQLHLKELQETNQRLNTNVEQLNKILYQQKNQLKALRNEVKQLKELIMQDTSQISDRQIETQRDKNEIILVNERCTKHETQINHLTDKINVKGDIFTYHNPQLEINISKCHSRTTVDLSKQQLLDRDLKTVVKQALTEKECTRLDIGYNSITSVGASIVADALKQNTTLEELNFHNNCVSDLGVHSLAKVLSSNTSIVKSLELGSNGITDKGAEHLAEMLKTNRSITWLALAGDRGVRLLANTVNHQNSNLLILSLHVNKSISDASVDAIIDILQHNRSLKKLWMQDCNISEDGKMKLREAAKSKQNFSLYM